MKKIIIAIGLFFSLAASAQSVLVPLTPYSVDLYTDSTIKGFGTFASPMGVDSVLKMSSKYFSKHYTDSVVATVGGVSLSGTNTWTALNTFNIGIKSGGDVLPSASYTQNIGSGSLIWSNGYFGQSHSDLYTGNGGDFKAGGTTNQAGLTVFSATGNTALHALGASPTDNGSKLQVNGSMSLAYVATATSITLTAANSWVDVTATGQTITLPTAVGCAGRYYTIKLKAVGSVTVATTSSQTIDGATTVVLAAQYGAITVQSDGANWNSESRPIGGLGTTTQLLHGGATGLYAAVGLTTDITGILPGTNGGTGVNNSTRTMTYAGNVAFTGAFNPTFAIPASVTYTYPAAAATLYGTNTGGITSSQLLTSLTDETGTGTAVFSVSPAFTVTPTAPTAALNTNTTQLATTAFVQQEKYVAAQNSTGLNVNNTLSYITPSDATVHFYLVQPYVNITTNAGLVATLTCTVTFFDETNTSQTKTLYNNGSTTAAFSALGASTIPSILVPAYFGTTMSVTFTYNSQPILYNNYTTITKVR